MLPGSFFLENAGVLNTFLGFLVAVVMIFFIEKSYSLLMSKYDDIGGEYTYAKKTFGKNLGFFTGWLLLLAYVSIIPLNATAIPMVFEKILPFYSRGSLLYTVVGFPVYLNDTLVSLAFIFMFAFVQIKDIKYSAKIQNVTVFALLISILLLLLLTILNINDSNYLNFESNMGELELDLVIRIIAFAPWAFIGFDTVAQLKHDSGVNGKKASLMAFTAVISGAVVYNVVNLITAFGIDSSEIDSSSWATGDAIQNMLGSSALIVIGCAMFGAVLSGLNGFFISAAKLGYAMLELDYYKNDKGTEKKVIIFICVISMVVPFLGRNALFWFVDVSSVGASFAYLVTCLSAYKLSTTKRMKVFSILGVICSTLFLIFLLTPLFASNIPYVSAVVLVSWILLGGVFIISKKYSQIYQ